MYRFSCSCRACEGPSRFIFQWYSVKENSKPITDRKPFAERGVCANFRHMVEIITKDNPYDELPNGLVDFETQDIQYPEILNIVERAVSIKTNPEALELFVKEGDEALRKIPGLLRKIE